MPISVSLDRLVSGGVFLLVPLVALLGEGCSSSATSSRDTGGETSAIVQDDDEFRVIARVRAEEMSEDDRKVNIEARRREWLARARFSLPYSNLTPRGINRDQVLLEVVGFLGVPYRRGGSTKRGVDCSGFTLQIYSAALNRMLPRSAAEQYGVGKEIPIDSLQFGDLVFFNTIGRRRPSHVGIYIEDDVFAHASVSYGVTFSSLESTYYRKRFLGARRLAD